MTRFIPCFVCGKKVGKSKKSIVTICRGCKRSATLTEEKKAKLKKEFMAYLDEPAKAIFDGEEEIAEGGDTPENVPAV